MQGEVETKDDAADAGVEGDDATPVAALWLRGIGVDETAAKPDDDSGAALLAVASAGVLLVVLDEAPSVAPDAKGLLPRLCWDASAAFAGAGAGAGTFSWSVRGNKNAPWPDEEATMEICDDADDDADEDDAEGDSDGSYASTRAMLPPFEAAVAAILLAAEIPVITLLSSPPSGAGRGSGTSRMVPSSMFVLCHVTVRVYLFVATVPPGDAPSPALPPAAVLGDDAPPSRRMPAAAPMLLLPLFDGSVCITAV